MEPNQNTSLFGLSIDQNASSILKAAAQWGRILAICGFIVGGLMIILGIIVQSTVSNLSGGYGYRSSDAGIFGAAAMIVYVLFGLIFIVSSIFALNFANKTSTGLKGNDQNSLNAGLAGIRNYLAFWAILLILWLLLVLIAILNIAASS